NHIAKWDGVDWSALGSGVTFDTQQISPRVNALVISQSDLYVGGHFSNAGEVSASSIAKWNGNSWSALGEGVWGNRFDSPIVHNLAISGTGEMVVGGRFMWAGEKASANVAKANLRDFFQEWAEALPPGERGEADDPGGYGIGNLLRYAF